ncbi:MAG TPA: zinc ribbon domain-containing protein [Flavipsychrobacter sp.]
MNDFNCQHCDKITSNEYNFCIECDKQTICLNCSNKLLPNKAFCFKCGTPIPNIHTENSTSSNHYVRVVEKKGEDYKERTEFTLSTEAVHVLAPLVISNNSQTGIDISIPIPLKKVEQVIPLKGSLDSPATENATDKASNLASSTNTFFSNLFDKTESGWILINPELKATSKGDYVKRLTCLFLLFQHESGIINVPRNEIIELLNHCGVYDSNFRTWLKADKTLLYSTAKEVKLILPGTQYAKEVVQEILNTEIPNGWKLGTVRKRSNRKGTKEAE